MTWLGLAQRGVSVDIFILTLAVVHSPGGDGLYVAGEPAAASADGSFAASALAEDAAPFPRLSSAMFSSRPDASRRVKNQHVEFL